MKNTNDVFTGTVDQLLDHCSNIDLNVLDEQLKIEEKQECIQVMMKELECDEFEAQKIYDEISLVETKNMIDKMVEDGIVEVVGHNEEGEPLFGLTKLGHQIQKEIDNQNKK
jgi:hypothetical protein